MADEQTVQRLSDVASAAAARAQAWERALGETEDRTRSHDLILGPSGDGIEFTQRLLDLLFGGDDAFTAADGLREASREVPESFSPRDRLAVRASGAASLSLPWAVMPLAKRWLRDRVAHLVLVTRLPERPEQLDRRSRGPLTSPLTSALRRWDADGATVSLAFTGDPVHGPSGAERELDRLRALASLPEVTRLVVDPARLSPGGSEWSASDDIRAATGMLQAILETCLEHDTAISIEPTSYRWALLSPEVLIRAAADARFDAVRLGIRLSAELPESHSAAERLLRWARARKHDGGTPLEIVVGDAAMAGDERVASLHSGLPVPTLGTRHEIDAQLLRLAGLLLRSGDAGVRTVIASESPRIVAAAHEIAQANGEIEDRFAVRVRAGVAPEFARVLRADGIDVRVLLPVTVPDELSGVVGSLVALAAEAAERTQSEAPEEAVATDIERLLERAEDPFPDGHRTQLRSREWHPGERDSALFYRPPDEPAEFPTAGLTAAVLGLSRSETGEITLEDFAPTRTIPVVSASGFANEPVTDATRPENREWAAALIAQAAHDADPNVTIEVDRELLRQLRREETAAANGDSTDATDAQIRDAEALLDTARTAQERWAAQPPKTRALRLRRAALGAAAARDRLTHSLIGDTGAPMREVDAQVGDLVDTARYHGQLAEGLAAVRGAEFLPGGLALIVSSSTFTLAEQAEEVIAALAAGCAVLWAAPGIVQRSASVLVEEWEAAGLTDGTVRLLPDSWNLRLIHGVDRISVLGDRTLAEAIRRRRPDTRLDARFLTTGSLTVTPAAAGDEAIRDLARSAFTGPLSRRVHAAILVGRQGRSKHFRERLVDAVRALRVGDTRHAGSSDPLGFEVGPLTTPPDAAERRALTELERGEEWVLEPKQLDDDGLLWSPGIRAGVAPTSDFWRDAQRIPVLGLVRARSIGEAIALQNRLSGGSHATLHSLDADEIGPWLEKSEIASLGINRATSPVRIERQPVGGWNGAVMGMPALAGGPNRLITLGSWRARQGTRSSTLHLHGLDPEVQILIEASQEVLAYEQFDEVRRAALSDALTWRTKFGLFEDTIGLGVERNIVRYWPVPTQVRLAEGAPLAHLLRVVAAALVVRARITVSTGEVLPSAVATFLATQGIAISLERDDDWLERLSVAGATDGRDLVLERVRLIGGDRVRVTEWMSGQPQLTLWAEPVTMAGPVELFSMLREQSITANAVRHGIATVVPELDDRLS